jgi:AGZA family xanthine/uracil permease-like MFS transporter
MLSALLGATSLSFTLESSSGIKAGGKTGSTAIVAALACFSALFFFPLISSIPLFATTPALIAIGLFMTLEIKHIRWKDWSESIPAALTVGTIPVTFSIYEGFALGFVSYALIKAVTGKFKEVHPLCWGVALLFAVHYLV